MRDEVKPLDMPDDSTVHPSSFILHPLKAGEDFYTEGAAVVFTARYHLRRGYCCENGCRHCPYRGGARAATEHEENAVEDFE